MKFLKFVCCVAYGQDFVRNSMLRISNNSLRPDAIRAHEQNFKQMPFFCNPGFFYFIDPHNFL